MSNPCDRCGLSVGLFDWDFTDEDGVEHHWKICWNCDFEMINGRGDENTSIEDILDSRSEDDDLFD